STSVNAAVPPSTATSSIIPSVTTSRWRSGSFTVPSAARMASFVITMAATPWECRSGTRPSAGLPPLAGAMERDGGQHGGADQQPGEDEPVAVGHGLLGVNLRHLRELVAQVALDAVPERGGGAVAAAARAVEPDRHDPFVRHVHQLEVA